MHALTLLLLLSPAQADEPKPATPRALAEIQAEAEAAFRKGVDAGTDPNAVKDFARSADLYAQLEQRGVRNVDLYRNLGNARFLAADLPGAILAYRLGLQFDPGNAELQRSLALAREQVDYATTDSFARPPADHWPPWLPRPTTLQLFITLFVLYTLALFCWVRWRITQRDGLIAFALTVSVLALIVAAFTLFEVRKQFDRAEHPLVVIAANDQLLRRGNGGEFPANHPSPLHKGVEAQLLFDGGAWLQIRLAGGEVGWVPRNAVLVESRPQVS